MTNALVIAHTEDTMTEEHTTEPAGQPAQPASDPWQEVGKQFQLLGESLATALRAGWESEENRRHLQEMKNGMEAMVREVGSAIQDTAATPQAHQARAEAHRAAESMRAAGQQALQQARPHLVSALRQVNEELQKMINRLESSGSAAGTTPPPTRVEDPLKGAEGPLQSEETPDIPKAE